MRLLSLCKTRLCFCTLRRFWHAVSTPPPRPSLNCRARFRRVSHAARSAKQSRRWKGCCTATFVYSNKQLYRRADRIRMLFSALHESAHGRFCCKSLFALAIKSSFGRRRDFRVKMWGTSSPEDKLTGDLGNVIEATSIGGRPADFFTAKKLASGNLGLLQQYLPQADSCTAANSISIRSPRRRAREASAEW